MSTKSDFGGSPGLDGFIRTDSRSNGPRKRICHSVDAESSFSGFVREILPVCPVRELFVWQRECLHALEGALGRGKNFLVSAPTSGGKTLVAQLALLHTVLIQKKKAVFVVPLVSLVLEKTESFISLGIPGLVVVPYFGIEGQLPPRSGPTVIVATMEKARGLICCLLRENRIGELGAVAVDEIHMIGDADRGVTLESVLASLLFLQRRGKCDVQILGMSATCPNLFEFADWLDGSLYVSSIRPVPLKQFIVFGGVVHDLRKRPARMLFPDNDEGSIEILIREVIPRHSVIVFCSTRADAETRAYSFASKTDPVDLTWFSAFPFAHRGLPKVLGAAAAFHHAGLMAEERKFVENGFRDGFVQVLFSTTTLAAGVNLPAYRVLIVYPVLPRKVHASGKQSRIPPLAPSQFQQMAGRAGRAGLDTDGQAFLVVRKAERNLAFSLCNSPLERVTSRLLDGPKEVRTVAAARVVLDAVGVGLVKTLSDLRSFLSCCLAFCARRCTGLIETALRCAEDCLLSRDLISISPSNIEGENEIFLTSLGYAVHRSGFTIEQGLLIHEDLLKAAKCISLRDELHLCFLSTPLDGFELLRAKVDAGELWSKLLSETLNDHRSFVMGLLGLQREYVAERCRGSVMNIVPDLEAIAQRFWGALVLYDVIHEVPVPVVADVYHSDAGSVRTFMQASSYHASGSAAFCEELSLWSMQALFKQYTTRFNLGVKREILPLVEIPGVKRSRARALWDAGFRSVKDIADADVDVLAKICEGNPKNSRILGSKLAGRIRSGAQTIVEMLDKQQKLKEEIEVAQSANLFFDEIGNV